MKFIERKNEKGDKINFHYDYGRGKGQRPSTGIFIYSKPTSQIERNHNKEALQILEIKKSQVTIQSQAIGTGYIPSHRFKKNFLEYYQEYIDLNKREINRALPCSLNQFKSFVGSDFVAPIEITEN